MIGRRGREQGQGHVALGQTSVTERRGPGCRCQTRQRIAVLDPTPLANAGTTLDPTGIETELRFDLGVFNSPRRHRMAETDKAG